MIPCSRCARLRCVRGRYFCVVKTQEFTKVRYFRGFPKSRFATCPHAVARGDYD